MDEESDPTYYKDMDGKEETKDEDPVVGSSTQIKEGNSSKGKDTNNDELHERDPEGLSKKSRREWKDYAKSQMSPMLEKPKSGGSTELPLRRSMEELRLEKPDNDRKSGTPKTSAMSGNPNTSHSSSTKYNKFKKKNKKLPKNENERVKEKDPEATGRIEDPTGPIDLPPNDNDNGNDHEKNESNIVKYIACKVCDKRFRYHNDWSMTLRKHNKETHYKDARIMQDDYYIVNEVVENDQENAVRVDKTREDPIKYITFRWCDRVYVDMREFANHCRTFHDKNEFTNADFNYLGRQYPDEMQIEQAMEVKVVTTENIYETNMDQDDILILSPNEEERKELKENMECTGDEMDKDNETFKRKVINQKLKFRIHYDKNYSRRTTEEAMTSHMHQ